LVRVPVELGVTPYRDMQSAPRRGRRQREQPTGRPVQPQPRSSASLPVASAGPGASVGAAAPYGVPPRDTAGRRPMTHGDARQRGIALPGGMPGRGRNASWRSQRRRVHGQVSTSRGDPRLRREADETLLGYAPKMLDRKYTPVPRNCGGSTWRSRIPATSSTSTSFVCPRFRSSRWSA